MSDRDRIAAVLRDHFVISARAGTDSVEACGGCGWQEHEGLGDDIQSHQADMLIAAGATMPAPQQRCNKPLGDPGRFCKFDSGHEGECW